MNANHGKNPPGLGPGPRDSTPTTATGRNTRQSAPLQPPTRDEIINSDFAVKDAQSGELYLYKNSLIPTGEPTSLENIVNALLHISQLKGVNRPASEAIRSVAFLLEKELTTKIATAIASQISTHVTQEVVSHFLTAISPHVATLLVTNDALNANVGALEDVKTAADSINTGANIVKDAVDQLTPSLTATQESIKTFLSAASDLPSNTLTGQPNVKSYSEALRSQTPPTAPLYLSTPATAALARAAVRERQVLIDPLPGYSLHTPEQTTASIVEKLTTILNETKDESGPELTIKAITRLKNGGLLIEFDTAGSANWIQQDENKANFLERLNTPAVIRDRSYVILIPFLPISSPLDDPQWHRSIELENNLSENSITSARWIKLKARRNPNQRVAHAILTFSEPKAANTLLRDGVYICKEKLHPRKDKKDPLHCVRCQGWGHLARDCKAAHDTCAQCAHSHRTDECSPSNRKRHCVNCNADGHGSNDPKCPVFLIKCAELDAKHPENSMPYFPTEEPWTQVTLPPKPPPLPKAPNHHQHGPPNNNDHPPCPAIRQTTLDSTLGRQPKPPYRNHNNARPDPNTRNTPNAATSSNAIPRGPRRSQSPRHTAPEHPDRPNPYPPLAESWFL